ncbi:hypothetical protein ZWY2020_039313 [Hordeum vulgare]|nr:hypothetical protein ZWY2020_039313 [Hordeum vulgare]
MATEEDGGNGLEFLTDPVDRFPLPDLASSDFTPPSNRDSIIPGSAYDSSMGDVGDAPLSIQLVANAGGDAPTLSTTDSQLSTGKDDPQTAGWAKRCTGPTVPDEVLPCVLDPSKIHTYNWGQYLLDGVMDAAIYTRKEDGLQGVYSMFSKDTLEYSLEQSKKIMVILDVAKAWCVYEIDITSSTESGFYVLHYVKEYDGTMLRISPTTGLITYMRMQMAHEILHMPGNKAHLEEKIYGNPGLECTFAHNAKEDTLPQSTNVSLQTQNVNVHLYFWFESHEDVGQCDRYAFHPPIYGVLASQV